MNCYLHVLHALCDQVFCEVRWNFDCCVIIHNFCFHDVKIISGFRSHPVKLPLAHKFLYVLELGPLGTFKIFHRDHS